MSGIAAVFLGAAILALLASMRWAARRYARFEKRPQHFGITGEATYLGPPALIIWQLPLLFIIVLLAIACLFAFVPRELQNGDPTIGMAISAVALVSAHGFILWLTERWAKVQP